MLESQQQVARQSVVAVQISVVSEPALLRVVSLRVVLLLWVLLVPALLIAGVTPSLAETRAAESEQEHFSSGAWSLAAQSASSNWSRAAMLADLKSQTKLEGLNRQKVLQLLGQPQRSDEVLPDTEHRRLVDFYSLSFKNDRHFRVEYDNQDRVLGSYCEPAPLMVPRFMSQSRPAMILAEAQLNTFLSGNKEEEIRKMSVADVNRQLGAPARSWRETSRAGGRNRHWLQELYFLTADGRRAFLVIFDADSDHVYEYRLQAVTAFRLGSAAHPSSTGLAR